MTRYAALLRGVNVNGITIKSADLKALFVELGFDEVRTVLASGNVLFNAVGRGAAKLKARIEKALRERFDYDAWIVLVTQAKLAKVLAAYPFPRQDDELQPYVVFGSDRAALAELMSKAKPVLDDAIERLQAGAGVLYWQVPRGRSTETPVARLCAKPRYKAAITTRNLRTVEKLAQD